MFGDRREVAEEGAGLEHRAHVAELAGVVRDAYRTTMRLADLIDKGEHHRTQVNLGH